MSHRSIVAPERRRLPYRELTLPARTRPRLDIDPEPVNAVKKATHLPWPHVQQRERLLSLTQNLPKLEWQTAIKAPEPVQVANKPEPSPAKPRLLRPTDYGVCEINNDSLLELQLFPGRPPDIRVAVSAAIKIPSRTVLPNGHPKFIVFRRDAASNVSDRAEVRIIAKVAREFLAGPPAKSQATVMTRGSSGTWRSRFAHLHGERKESSQNCEKELSRAAFINSAC